jgi:hypothetical protein
MTRKGWREAKIEHFNTICKMVSADQNINPVLVECLKVWWEQTSHVPRQKVNKDEEWVHGLTPFHHLWDDYDDITDKAVTHLDKESDGNEHRGAYLGLNNDSSLTKPEIKMDYTFSSLHFKELIKSNKTVENITEWK